MNSILSSKYCNSLTEYSRFQTRVVQIGEIPMGGNHPIRVQSMTTTDTMNTEATVQQSIRIIEAGADYVRITAPSLKEAANLENIRKELRKAGFQTPLIADIHFTPNAAELAARIVEKVRVNPGNYADKKKFEITDFSDSAYQAELERIREKFVPLVKICKEYGTAMRIGANHGSLSDRIMSRYGDTPLGMVESALEFVRICREWDYHQIVLSMKASNPQVMVQAYRLLVNRMMEEQMDYPLHLGVTEAGDGEDGRIKSAVGIGSLMEDGLGDTIRVSLTEDPELEIPVAKALVARYNKRTESTIPAISALPIDPFVYSRRVTREVFNIGGNQVPVVVADLSRLEKITPASLFSWGYRYSIPLDKWNLTDFACDYVFVGNNQIEFEIPGMLGIIQNHECWSTQPNRERCYPLISASDFLAGISTHAHLNFIQCSLPDLQPGFIQKLKEDKTAVLVVSANTNHAMAELRRLIFELMNTECPIPVLIFRDYSGEEQDTLPIDAGADIGPLLLDGLGDGIWLKVNKPGQDALICRTAFGILQATRTRISKTEYISCPSCGRTLFDLQETTAKIRAVTAHLKGVKIGIMGCIVNGPGEMADADYGYVGTGPGKITLYKEKEVVKRNVPELEAVTELIELIKSDGRWVELNPETAENANQL